MEFGCLFLFYLLVLTDQDVGGQKGGVLAFYGVLGGLFLCLCVWGFLSCYTDRCWGLSGFLFCWPSALFIPGRRTCRSYILSHAVNPLVYYLYSNQRVSTVGGSPSGALARSSLVATRRHPPRAMDLYQGNVWVKTPLAQTRLGLTRVVFPHKQCEVQFLHE